MTVLTSRPSLGLHRWLNRRRDQHPGAGSCPGRRCTNMASLPGYRDAEGQDEE
jgi:hypothetical protein